MPANPSLTTSRSREFYHVTSFISAQSGWYEPYKSLYKLCKRLYKLCKGLYEPCKGLYKLCEGLHELCKDTPRCLMSTTFAKTTALQGYTSSSEGAREREDKGSPGVDSSALVPKGFGAGAGVRAAWLTGALSRGALSRADRRPRKPDVVGALVGGLRPQGSAWRPEPSASVALARAPPLSAQKPLSQG